MIHQLGVAFAQIILPVVIIGGCGFVAGRARPIDVSAVTALTVSVLVPAVVFDSLTRATLPRELLARLALHVVVQIACVAAVTLLVTRMLGWRGASESALLMATLFTNAGNMGLPIALFAFGRAGLAIAGGWFAIMAISGHTLGVYIVARARYGTRAAFAHMLRLPITYAIVAGLLIKGFDARLPEPIAKAAELLAAGSVAVLLLLLGLNLARMTFRAEALGATVASTIRLALAPPIAWVTARLVGLEGMPLSVAVLQSSMPTAVTAALWAMEFDTRPDLVSATVVLSTLASVVTLTVLLAVL